ncbi:hypothetical protein [Rhodoferax saidenbachensis]|uniref:Uncharacterized protein n=1 Tax=Rhodoferax saidenbachensis TaxID=1484693 RepID=A0ABU1ZKB0_9BURK|nr:hypothetical protein [Rhodoferax saidenbachensis]MDR7305991.1 hypothetical protein [Rhodoferax saidenbachensis]
MDLILIALVAGGILFLKKRDQRQRIVLLGHALSRYDIERLMEGLTDGYLRALGEDNAERQAQVWNFLAAQELRLLEQFQAFATEFANEDPLRTRVSKLPMAIPYATVWLPAATFDLRRAFAIHAQGLAQVVENAQQLSPKRKAFTLSAELFLMQHSCHWFCRSKSVASARLLARHKTPYAQVLASVSPATRAAYTALVSGVA